jgi:hypothetical protein
MRSVTPIAWAACALTAWLPTSLVVALLLGRAVQLRDALQ